MAALAALLVFAAPSARAQEDGGIDAAIERDAAEMDASSADDGGPDAMPFDATVDVGDLRGPPPVGSTLSPDGLGFCCLWGGTCDGAHAGGFSETGGDCYDRLIFDAHPAAYWTSLDEHGCDLLHTPLEPVCNPLAWADVPLDASSALDVGATPPTPGGGCGCVASRASPSEGWLLFGLGVLLARARGRKSGARRHHPFVPSSMSAKWE